MSDYLDMEERALRIALVDLDVFHFTDLAQRAGIHEETARRYILRWEQDGKVRLARKEWNRRFYIAADKPIPCDVAPKETGSTAEGNMWRTMRNLPQFSPLDVAAHSNVGSVEVTVEKAAAYCRRLVDAGYLRVVKPAVHGRSPAVYRLVRYTGPQAPLPKRMNGLYDPNEDLFLPNGTELPS